MFVERKILERLKEESKSNERKRSHLLLHDSIEDEIQQIAFCIQPETLTDVHKHIGGTETIICLKGSIAITLFTEDGMKIYLLNNENPIFKFNPVDYHTYTSLEEDTIGIEIKEGPYIKDNFINHDKNNQKKERITLNNVILKRVDRQYG